MTTTAASPVFRLTADGESRLTKLAPAHLDELQNLAPVLDQLVARWKNSVTVDPAASTARSAEGAMPARRQ